MITPDPAAGERPQLIKDGTLAAGGGTRVRYGILLSGRP
jgi:hypothetical protein